MRNNDVPQLLYLLSVCRMWQKHFEAMRYVRPAKVPRAVVIPFPRPEPLEHLARAALRTSIDAL